MKIVINKCYGGFDLSNKAYEKLIEYGVPARPYTPQERDEKTMRYKPHPLNDGRVIFTSEEVELGVVIKKYWSYYFPENRADPFLVRVVEELGDEANGFLSQLKVIEVPNGADFEIYDYDGMESIHEEHEQWD